MIAHLTSSERKFGWGWVDTEETESRNRAAVSTVEVRSASRPEFWLL